MVSLITVRLRLPHRTRWTTHHRHCGLLSLPQRLHQSLCSRLTTPIRHKPRESHWSTAIAAKSKASNMTCITIAPSAATVTSTSVSPVIEQLKAVITGSASATQLGVDGSGLDYHLERKVRTCSLQEDTSDRIRAPRIRMSP